MNDLLVLIFGCMSAVTSFGLAVFLWQLHLMERERQIRELGRAYR